MKAMTLITFITLLLGCQPSTIKMDEVESIKIVFNQMGQHKDAVVIKEVERIKEIVSMVETAEREPVKFLADYKVEVKFKDSTTILLVRNNLLNYQGITYRLKNDLGKKLDEITKAAQ